MNSRILFVLLTNLCLVRASHAAATPFTDPVFDFRALTSTPLNPRVLSTTEKDGIVTEEVRFHSETDGAKDVDIYGLFSYPKGAKKLPAFVWNQAGLAQASDYFPVLGARRGYAVLCIDMPMPGYRSTGNYNISMDFPANMPPKQNPIYHGAVALLKAVSYLESRPEVDADKIGMAGSSWGGFYTTLMAGVDPRLKAASAMFGTGSLQLGNVWWDATATPRDEAFRETWRTTLDPAYRLPYSKTAIAWFSGTNDHFFWMPALMKSYEMAGGPKHLTLVPNWNHGLPPKQDDQVFQWLDIYLQGAPDFLKISPLRVTRLAGQQVLACTVTGTRKIKEAQILLSPGEEGNWENRPWAAGPMEKDGETWFFRWPLFHPALHVAASVIDTDGNVTSSPMRFFKAPQLTPSKPEVHPLGTYQFNGAPWGEFEPSDIDFLKGLAFANPTVSLDAHSGQQSIALVAGRNVFRPLYFTVGLQHRLWAYLRADKRTKITVELNGSFDGVPQSTMKDFDIGTEWTLVSLDYIPPVSKFGSINVCFNAPDGVKVNLDSLTFTPSRPFWSGLEANTSGSFLRRFY